MVPPVFGELNVTAVEVPELHTTWFEMTATVAFGRTVIVKVLGVPAQEILPLANVGVTVIVAISGAVPELVAVNAAILPEPEVARPIFGLLMVQP